MKIIPAVDVRCGEFVVFVPNQDIKEKFRDHDPVGVTRHWKSKGAEEIYFTDYDGLFKSSPQNLEVLKEIKNEVNCIIYYSGGVSSAYDLKRALDAGADYIVINISNFRKSFTKDPLFLENTHKIIAGIDLKDGEYAVEGFNNPIHINAEEKLQELFKIGINKVIITDITKKEPKNKSLLKGAIKLADQIGYNIIVAGGITSLLDVEFLSSASEKEFDAVVIGRALYMGLIKYRNSDEFILLV